MSALRLVVFDCDGTLVDSQNGIVASMTAAFESLGLQYAVRFLFFEDPSVHPLT